MYDFMFDRIALFTGFFFHLHYNVYERGCEAIFGEFCSFCLKLPHVHVPLNCHANEKSEL